MVLKLTYLCKCTRRPHGSMVFEVLAPCILIIFHGFLITSNVDFRFVLGSIWEDILDSFGIHFWSFGWSKSRQDVINNRCENWPGSQNASLAGGRRGLKGEVNFPPLGRSFGRREEKKKGRKEEGKKGGRKVGRKTGRVYTLILVGRRISLFIL